MSTVFKSIEQDPAFYGTGLKRCVVLGKGSDIAREMMGRLAGDGWDISGYSHDEPVQDERWDLLLVTAGTLAPIGRFVDLDFKRWSQGIVDNAINPLAFVREILPHAKYNALVVFFSGPNPHQPAPKYTAYDAAKTLLIRMTENLQAEHTNVRFVCIGPGFHNTKIHTVHDVSERREVDSYRELYDMLKTCIRAPAERLGRQIHIREPWRDILDPFRENEGT